MRDAVMPNGISGLDLARYARRRRQDLKIVLMSGYVRETDSRTGTLSDLVFLEKPFRRAQLAETLASAFDDSSG
jgi:CheY-like chemotaxis protein